MPPNQLISQDLKSPRFKTRFVFRRIGKSQHDFNAAAKFLSRLTKYEGQHIAGHLYFRNEIVTSEL